MDLLQWLGDTADAEDGHQNGEDEQSRQPSKEQLLVDFAIGFELGKRGGKPDDVEVFVSFHSKRVIQYRGLLSGALAFGGAFACFESLNDFRPECMVVE